MPNTKALKNNKRLIAYAGITGSYWVFMLTDGALRMLTLLHFHTLGFSPLQLAYLFVVYEVMGVLMNVFAGWLGTRRGVKQLVFIGLTLQLIAVGSLLLLNPAWSVWGSVAFVMIVQGISGCAKDLTKTGSKSAIKKLIPTGNESSLLRWVTLLTGSKNAIKGIGFFVGAALLAIQGFDGALVSLMTLLALALIGFISLKSVEIGTVNSKVKIRDVLSPDAKINRLSVARLFLFASRDTWFVVALPIFLVSVTAQSTDLNQQQAFFATGGFMAIWVIGYGIVQALTPRWFADLGSDPNLKRSTSAATTWCGWLLLLMTMLSLIVLFMHISQTPTEAGQIRHWLVVIVISGLLLFGVVFAINSALHSYLILLLTSDSRATMDVGFYYMANAGGRLAGTLLSGISYQLGGLSLCLIISAGLIGISYFSVGRLLKTDAHQI